MIISLLLLAFIILVIFGFPIAMVLLFLAVLPNLINPWFPADPQYIIRAMISGVNSFPLMAVPMFILSGHIMAKGKISDKIFNFFSYFIAEKKAGIPITCVVTCLFYGAISGSGPATVAAVGSMTIPLMEKIGYEKNYAAALVACAGGLGVIIPPSIPLIFYGQSSGLSVSDLFIGGILPGLLLGFLLIIYAYFYDLKKGQDRKKLIIYSQEIKNRGLKNLFKDSFFSLLLPIIILGSIYRGVASPTEAAVISVFYSLFISIFIYKTINLRDMKEVLISSVSSYCNVLFIIAAATGFARILTFLKTTEIVGNVIASSITSKVALLIFINIFLLLVGMVMDTTPAILILTPLFLPIIKTFSIDPIYFGVMMVVNLAIGFVTPPLGVNLFVASSLAEVSLDQLIKRVIPFIGVFLFGLLLITAFPQISLLFLGD